MNAKIKGVAAAIAGLTVALLVGGTALGAQAPEAPEAPKAPEAHVECGRISVGNSWSEAPCPTVPPELQSKAQEARDSAATAAETAKSEAEKAKVPDITVPDLAIRGKDGKDGTGGRNGNDGRDGTDGRNGTDGVNGAAGNNGIDGEDGVRTASGGEPGRVQAASHSETPDRAQAASAGEFDVQNDAGASRGSALPLALLITGVVGSASGLGWWAWRRMR